MQSVLNEQVLKLNHKDWMPIASETLRKAIKNLCEDRAKVLDPETGNLYAFMDWVNQSIKDGDKYIRTPSLRIKVPEIIVINPGQKIKVNRRVTYNRRNIFRRDKGRCQYCGIKVDKDDWEIDHVLPRSRGGKSSFENCVVCCTKCNRKKGNKTLKEAGMKLVHYVKRAGKFVLEEYIKPIAPKWTPAYNIHIKDNPPKSWRAFIDDFVNDLYWGVELE